MEEVLLQEQKLPPVAVGNPNGAREVIEEEGRRFLVLVQWGRWRIEPEVLERRIAQGRSIAEPLRRSWVERPRHHPTLLGQAPAGLSAKGLSDRFEIDWDEAAVQVRKAKPKESRHRHRWLAGWWVLTTDTELPAEGVVELSTGLAVIEPCWRELKSVLEV